MNKPNLKIINVSISLLKSSDYNPRTWDEKEISDLTKSIKKYGIVDPILVNSAAGRKNIVIGGHFRLKVAADLGYKEIPVVYINIPDIAKEKELNLRLNKNQGRWNFELLANFNQDLLLDIGFESNDMDEIFGIQVDENYDVEKELERIIKEGPKRARDGDMWQLGNHRLIIGDCVDRKNWAALMQNDKKESEKFDFLFTDPPYRLAYAQRSRKITTKNGTKLRKNRTYLSTGKTDSKGRFKGFVRTKQGFGYRSQRTYLGVEKRGGVPEFNEWLSIANDYQNPIGANVMVFENWRNTIDLWQTIEKYWKIRNMVIWHLPNRTQGFSRPYTFFNKYDIAHLASKGNAVLNETYEQEFENFLTEKGSKLIEQFEIAIYGQIGKSEWFGKRDKKTKDKAYYKSVKGTRWAKVSDHMTWTADTAKSSGQNLVFGTKPIQILIPYIKILSPRDGIVMDPFGGSGSTLIASEIMQRQCRVMEIEPLYAEVILNRYERFTGKSAVKL